jgi:uncharacterized protein (DUF305 family)
MRIIAALLLAAALAGCRTAADPAPAIVMPGAPGEATRVITASEASDLSRVQHSPADVAFMQGMIHHHAQALEMVGLLQTRTTSEGMKSLAQRIELSQRDEIAFMQQWLTSRGQEAPGEHAHHMPGAPMMPGMLTPEEMDRLAGATGVEFDRLFLNLMIKHHLGAVAMVDDLLATPGAAQETEVFAFASDVVADQGAEMDRMGALLAALGSGQ